ncbi:heparan sulfate 2-O-sulfotransferase 1-like isoform X2 [Apostichopus japonicus]|uniref:heparan sulfate 2-O-sulfotransferase 1-like isoform X2 n=1 Tax=Stichopus japonicus TaxID=307972 RepID=UPI003AB4E5DE
MVSCVAQSSRNTDDDMTRVIHWFPIKALVHSRFVLMLAAFLIVLGVIEIQVHNLQTSIELLDKSLHSINSRKLRDSDTSPFPMVPGKGGDDSQELLVIYNRVPKTGSTSFTGIAYDLCKGNNFNVLHVNTTKSNHTKNDHVNSNYVMSVQDQMRYILNATHWNSRLPAFHHGHFAFIDFAAFGSVRKPMFINIIRRPLDRLISFYFFVRYGDDFRPSLVRHRMDNKETFDECVKRKGYDCHPDRLWIQVPYFCGHAEECWKPGSRWALEQAKYNMIHRYLLVGVTEELEEFIALLEATLPSMFKGALNLYRTGKRSHLRKTSRKDHPSEETLEFFRQNPVWQMEEEFYNFVLENFHAVKQRSLGEDNSGRVAALERQFTYEKVRPR